MYATRPRHHRRHIWALLAVAAALIIAFPTSAFAWRDSTDDHPENPLADRYWGTHDWVVFQAYEAAGSPEWFDLATAVMAADDPDRMSSKKKADHVYQIKRNWGGAPNQVANLYSKAISQYNAGDYTGASRTIGVLSHYYSDACVPFHAAGRKDDGDMERSYEEQVKWVARLRWQKDVLRLRERRSPTDVRAATIAAARVGYGQYWNVRGNWSHGGIGNPTVKSATTVVLSEAVNGLSDMIAAVPSGSGQAVKPARFAVYKPYRRYVRKHSKVGMQAKIVDAAGRPIQGVKVTFTWKFRRKTIKHVRYTHANGYAQSWQNSGSQPYGKRVYVTAVIDTPGAPGPKRTWFKTRRR